MTNSATKVIFPTDRRYERTEYQEFMSFSEGEALLRVYCGQCGLERTCRSTKDLRASMGDNCPFWAKEFVKLQLKEEYHEREFSADKLGEEELPQQVIACKKFKRKGAKGRRK